MLKNRVPASRSKGRRVPSNIMISAEKLSRLIGTPNCPSLIDVRSDDEWAAAPLLIPGAQRRPHKDASEWAAELIGRPAVAICRDGAELGHGVAAWLRHLAVSAELLEGGTKEWLEADLPVVRPQGCRHPIAKAARCGSHRSRPKVDRIACPWLLRRFVDPRAVFLFVAPADVAGVARQFAATPFDVEGAFFGHRDDANPTGQS
jgi:rhodanese-related sulfurtransferase